jgi:Zn-dependent alcohol dehydrogenase
MVTGDMAMDPAIIEMLGWQQYPIILGHEGGGIVEKVGPGVTELKVGDHVVTSFVPSCGRCPSCAKGQQNLCDNGAHLLSGRQEDGTSRHHLLDGTDLATMCCLGTFAEHSVMNINSLVKVEEDLPLDKACLVACGVTTGWGSATYAAEVAPGDTVVVIGTGGVGMNAVQGAHLAGARYVIALDPVEFKRGKPKLHRADEVQLCAQALCLEDMSGRLVPQGALFYAETRRRREVVFDAELRALTEETAAAIRDLLLAGRTPPAVYRADRCRACSLIEPCRPKASTASARAFRAKAIRDALSDARDDSAPAAHSGGVP